MTDIDKDSDPPDIDELFEQYSEAAEEVMQRRLKKDVVAALINARLDGREDAKMTNANKRRTDRMYSFHRCPNTGVVLVTSFEDDKVLCRCGATNPSVPREEPGVHVKNFLEPATIEEFLEQERSK